MKKILLLLICLVGIVGCQTNSDEYGSWTNYGGTKKNTHFSSLIQINKNNVKNLHQVWEFASGDMGRYTQIQANPIIIDSVLYGVSPKLKLFALNARTGKLLWEFDPYKVEDNSVKGVGYFSMNVCRGITYYKDKKGGRIFYAAGSNLFSIDTQSGKPIESFAQEGKLDLHRDLERDVSNLYVAMTSPGIIFQDMIIIGTRVSEGAQAAPGYIRAYNVHTGTLKWIFHTIPQPGEDGYNTWEDPNAWMFIGGANAWSGFSMDEENGIIFVPVGSASYDFYGGNRKGANLFANSLLALDAKTGKRLWHYQTVHHDLWDRDLPTPPVVANITKDNQNIPVVIQPTKSGYLFVLNRFTGKPVFDIEEVDVPSTPVLEGEKLSRTQPIVTKPEPFARQTFTINDINPLIPKYSQDSIRKVLESIKSTNVFDPPSKEGTLIFPGFDGGAEWGGPAYNPKTEVLFINANEMPWILTMVSSEKKSAKNNTIGDIAKQLYSKNCMVCHGKDRQGSGNYPPLVNVKQVYSYDSLVNTLGVSRGMMPSFNQLTKEEKDALASYLLDMDRQTEPYGGKSISDNPYYDVPYVSTGYHKFLSPEGYPAINPPWGTLTAIDMVSGGKLWQIPLGETPEFEKKGIRTGTENYGGPVATASGLLFIAATKDSKIRAFDQNNGTLLWEAELPYPGYATPSIYQIDGKEYLIIACGGGKLGSPSGDRYVAFSL